MSQYKSVNDVSGIPIKSAYNVPAVGDVFAARISKTVGFAGLQKCGGVRRGNGVAMT
jgi:hypothetical protein